MESNLVPRKALFRSAISTDTCQNTEVTDNGASNVMSRLQFDHDVYSSVKMLQKDQHDKRLSTLRDLLQGVSDDNWKYPSIDSLLGL
ncbi:Uncharacterised protein g10832 [Pycnogonum litorale]